MRWYACQRKEPHMILPKALLKICSSLDERRYAITHVYVDVEQQCAIATDGHKLVYYPVEPDTDAGEVSGYVPKDAILAAANNKPFIGLMFHKAKDTTVPGKRTFPNPYATDDPPPKYPDWSSILVYPEQQYHHLCFNAKYLLEIADVLSPERKVIQLHYNPDNPGAQLYVTTAENTAMAVFSAVVTY